MSNEGSFSYTVRGNDAPVANADTITVNDTNDPSPPTYNILANDTTNPGETLTITSTSVTSKSGYGSPLISLSSFGDEAPNEFVRYKVTVNSPYSDDFIDQPTADAYITIFKNGNVTIVQNEAFDYLPVLNTLSFVINYTVDDGHGGSANANATIQIQGQDNSDVFDNYPNTLNAGIGNDLILYYTGKQTINGGDGLDTVDYTGSAYSITYTHSGGNLVRFYAPSDTLQEMRLLLKEIL